MFETVFSYAESMLQDAHLAMLHEGVSIWPLLHLYSKVQILLCLTMCLNDNSV